MGVTKNDVLKEKYRYIRVELSPKIHPNNKVGPINRH